MLRSATHPFVVATLLGGIVGATVAMIGGVRLRSEHLDPSGDPVAQKVWALDLFGLPTLTDSTVRRARSPGRCWPSRWSALSSPCC